jgi:molybdate transport system substrate-binding protein
LSLRALVVACLAASLTGCGATADADDSLRISVAVSLRPALEEALENYRASGRELDVVVNSGASGILLQQLRHGAPADLLISAGTSEVDRLVEERLADPATRRRLASNRLLVVVPRDGPLPSTLDDLRSEAYRRIAVGNPETAPLGRYTRAALDGAGLGIALAPRLIHAQNSRQTLHYVVRGEVDAGIVYASDLTIAGERVRPAVELPAAGSIAYEAILLVGARRTDRAKAFLDWLTSPAGRHALSKYGFDAP